MNKQKHDQFEPKEIWHPIEKKYIKYDWVVTDFGKAYYAAIARNIANKRLAKKLAER